MHYLGFVLPPYTGLEGSKLSLGVSGGPVRHPLLHIFPSCVVIAFGGPVSQVCRRLGTGDSTGTAVSLPRPGPSMCPPRDDGVERRHPLI